MEAIVFKQCSWCGEPFVQLNSGHKPRLTCSQDCHADNLRFTKAEGEARRRSERASK